MSSESVAEFHEGCLVTRAIRTSWPTPSVQRGILYKDNQRNTSRRETKVAFTFTKYSEYSVTVELAFSKIKALVQKHLPKKFPKISEVSFSWAPDILLFAKIFHILAGKVFPWTIIFALFVLLLRKREEMSQKCKKENFFQSKFCFSTNGALEFKIVRYFFTWRIDRILLQAEVKN
jgi:hypothetical protein